MSKTKFTRVAVAGLTASDGRTIEPLWLTQAAKNFNPATYPARVNVEHIRGLAADGPFPMLGDVVALRTQTDDIEIAGKTEKRLALYAQIEANDKLKGYLKADQKKYTSIEIEPNFNGTGEAYLMGLAATDSPASLGTEALQFSTRSDDDYAKIRKAELDKRKQTPTCLFSAAFATSIEFEDEAASPDADSLVDKIVGKIKLAIAPKEEPKPEPQQQQLTDPNAALVTAFTAGLKELGSDLAAAMKTSSDKADARFAKIESDFAALRNDVEATPSRNYTQRPPATGGEGLELADC